MNPTNLAVLTGANGFYGRWLLLDLLRSGRPVMALMRNPGSREAELRAWLLDHGARVGDLRCEHFDLTQVDLGVDSETRAEIASARDIYHLGGVFAFNLSAQAARSANVDGTRRLLDLAQGSSSLRRFVYASGYLLADDRHLIEQGVDADALYDSKNFSHLYRKLGSYEASKLEADRLVVDAGRLGLPITIIALGGLTGDATTGETQQWDVGFMPLVSGLANKKIAGLPRKTTVWTPLISVDFAAAFTARIVTLSESQGQRYALLDPNTPTTHAVARQVSSRLKVPMPRWRLGRRAMRLAFALKLAPGSAEQLAFLNDKRYDTSSMLAAAQTLGLRLPKMEQVIDACVDYAIAHRFGRAIDADVTIDRQ